MQNSEIINKVWFDIMNQASTSLFQRDIALVDNDSVVREYERLDQTDKDRINQILANNHMQMMNHNHLLMVSRF